MMRQMLRPSTAANATPRQVHCMCIELKFIAMKLFYGVVIKSQFQEVHSKKARGNLSLCQCTLVSETLDNANEFILFNIWGNAAKNQLRHRVGPGSILAIEEFERKSSILNGINESSLIVGSLIAYSDIVDYGVCIYDQNPIFLENINLRLQLAEIFEKVSMRLRHSLRWSVLHNSIKITSSKRVSTFQSMIFDTQTRIFDIAVAIPVIDIVTNSDITVIDADGHQSKLYFRAKADKMDLITQISIHVNQNDSMAPLRMALKKVLETEEMLNRHDFDFDSMFYDRSPYFERIFVSDPASKGKFSVCLKLTLQKLAVHSSYLRSPTSLRYIPNCTKIELPEESKIGPSHSILPSEEIHKEVPLVSGQECFDMTFLDWEKLKSLVNGFECLQQLNSISTPVASCHDWSNHFPLSNEVFLFCGFLKASIFLGSSYDTFHHNIDFPVASIGDQNKVGDWKYRDAYLMVSGSKCSKQVRSEQKIEHHPIQSHERQLANLFYQRYMMKGDGVDDLLGTQVPFQSLRTQVEETGLQQHRLNSQSNSTDLSRAQQRNVIFAILQYYLNHVQPLQKQETAGDREKEECSIRNDRPGNNIASPLEQDSLHTLVPTDHTNEEEEDIENGIAMDVLVSRKRKRGNTSGNVEEDDCSLGHDDREEIQNDETDTNDKIKDNDGTVIVMNTGKTLRCTQDSQWKMYPHLIWSQCTSIGFQPNECSVPPHTAFSVEKRLDEIPISVSHDYLMNKLFGGISPILPALELYRRENHETKEGDKSYILSCLEKIQCLQRLSESQSCMMFVCRLLPSVDEEGHFTGEVVLSLEDIV